MIINTRVKSVLSKKIKIIILTILSPVIILIIILAWGYVSRPFLDKFDQERFTKLNVQMQGLHKELEVFSAGADVWKYKAVCNIDRTGWLATGKYNCVTSISLQKTLASANDLMDDLHKKYFPVINNSDRLKSVSDLDVVPKYDFGKKFVVSSASQNYIELESNIECEYLIKLYQNDKTLSMSFDSYGSSIVGGRGDVFISLRCSDLARDSWYSLSDTADLFIP